MNLRAIQSDPDLFRSALLVDTDAGPQRLADVLDDWQAADFAALDSAWRRVAGQDIHPPYLRAWLERGRGHSKTTDIAVSAVWVLFASRRKIDGVACAADRDQAALIRDAADRLLRLNPWLADILKCQATKVINKHTGSVLTILSADVASSYGLLIDFAIVDELTHWSKRDLWDSIFSAIAKRRHGLLLVIANAGFRDSWQWELRKAIRNDPAWYFHRLDGPVASWISQEHLAEQRRLLPTKTYARLWGNQWSDGSGDALELADIDAALCRARCSGPERGYIYALGCDIGLTHDCTALALVGRHAGYSEPILSRRTKAVGTLAVLQDLELVPSVDSDIIEYRRVPGSDRLKLCRLEIWQPNGGKVDLSAVETRIAALHGEYQLSKVTADPWQAELMLQRLSRQGVPCEGLQMSGTTLQGLATAMLTEFRGRTIDLINDPTLAADLRNLRVASRSYGFRLESPTGGNHNGTPHGDTATALALAIRAARQAAIQRMLDPSRRLVYN
jgi:phage terminase large subunit-like protein